MFPNQFCGKTVEHCHHVAACQMGPPQTHTLWDFFGGNAEDDDRDFAAGDFPCPCGGSIGSGDGSGVGGGHRGGHG